MAQDWRIKLYIITHSLGVWHCGRKRQCFSPYFLSIVGPQYCRVGLGITWLADCHQHVPSYQSLMRAVDECLFYKISRHGLLLVIGALFFTIVRHEVPPDHGDLVIPVDELEGVNAVKGAVGIAWRWVGGLEEMKLRRIVGVAVEERLKFFGIRLPGYGVRSQREEFIEKCLRHHCEEHRRVDHRYGVQTAARTPEFKAKPPPAFFRIRGFRVTTSQGKPRDNLDLLSAN